MSAMLHCDKAFAARLVAAFSFSSALSVSGDKFIAAKPAASAPAGFNFVPPIAAISNQKKVASIIVIASVPTASDEHRFA